MRAVASSAALALLLLCGCMGCERKEASSGKEASAVGTEMWSPERVVQMASKALRERGIKSLEDAIWNIQPEPNGVTLEVARWNVPLKPISWVVTVDNLEGKYQHYPGLIEPRRYLSDSARFRLSPDGEISEWTYGIWSGTGDPSPALGSDLAIGQREK